MESDKKETIKVAVWVYIRNGGDGSGYPLFFSTQEAAEKYASYDDEYGERYCEDISKRILEFTLDGQLATPDPLHHRDESAGFC